MTTTTSDATSLVRDHMARVSAGDLAGAAALMAEDCLNHAAVPEAQGRDGFLRVITKLRAAFPDMAYQIEDVIAAGDRVVVRGTLTGTHRGALAFGALPLEPTNRAFSTEQIHIFRVADGRIVEHWLGRDDVGLFRQLGLKVTA